MTIQVLCVCGCGLGSSFAIEMTATSVLKRMAVKANVNHTTVSEANAFKSDVILTQKIFADVLCADATEEESQKVIVLDKLTDKREMEEKLTSVLKVRGLI